MQISIYVHDCKNLKNFVVTVNNDPDELLLIIKPKRVPWNEKNRKTRCVEHNQFVNQFIPSKTNVSKIGS